MRCAFQVLQDESAAGPVELSVSANYSSFENLLTTVPTSASSTHIREKGKRTRTSCYNYKAVTQAYKEIARKRGTRPPKVTRFNSTETPDKAPVDTVSPLEEITVWSSNQEITTGETDIQIPKASAIQFKSPSELALQRSIIGSLGIPYQPFNLRTGSNEPGERVDKPHRASLKPKLREGRSIVNGFPEVDGTGISEDFAKVPSTSVTTFTLTEASNKTAIASAITSSDILIPSFDDHVTTTQHQIRTSLAEIAAVIKAPGKDALHQSVTAGPFDIPYKPFGLSTGANKSVKKVDKPSRVSLKSKSVSGSPGGKNFPKMAEIPTTPSLAAEPTADLDGTNSTESDKTSSSKCSDACLRGSAKIMNSNSSTEVSAHLLDSAPTSKPSDHYKIQVDTSRPESTTKALTESHKKKSSDTAEQDPEPTSSSFSKQPVFKADILEHSQAAESTSEASEPSSSICQSDASSNAKHGIDSQSIKPFNVETPTNQRSKPAKVVRTRLGAPVKRSSPVKRLELKEVASKGGRSPLQARDLNTDSTHVVEPSSLFSAPEKKQDPVLAISKSIVGLVSARLALDSRDMSLTHCFEQKRKRDYNSFPLEGEDDSHALSKGMKRVLDLGSDPLCFDIASGREAIQESAHRDISPPHHHTNGTPHRPLVTSPKGGVRSKGQQKATQGTRRSKRGSQDKKFNSTSCLGYFGFRSHSR